MSWFGGMLDKMGLSLRAYWPNTHVGSGRADGMF